MKIENLLKHILEENHAAFFYTPSIYPNSKSYLFHSPSEILSVKDYADIDSQLEKIDDLLFKGYKAYGFITYETGYLFEKRLKSLAPVSGLPYLNFYFFNDKNVEVFNSSEIEFSKWNEYDFKLENFRLNTLKQEFIKDVERIRTYIAEGDTYQVNYTLKGRFRFTGNPVELFKQLVFNQSAQYSAFINKGENILISLSPELFFHIKGRAIETHPMKGTIKRGVNTREDQLQHNKLFKSEKNRAENLMIVDLLRNDLARVSEFNSVKVKELFKIEKYESLFQMISIIQSQLKDGAAFSDVIKNIFPSGSITGAPKIRTMQIINELETEPRGIYTGAIGILNKQEAVFNVPIRTIELNIQHKEGEVGLGSGIVWDSDPEKEYEETLLKSRFLINPLPYFEIFETMLVEKGEVFLLSYHLKRMSNAAEYFLFRFDKKNILKKINLTLLELSSDLKYRMKIHLDKWGSVTIEVKHFVSSIDEIKIILSEKRISSADRFQYFKTTNRRLYDEEYLKFAEAGYFDVIFLNEKDQVCEGAITNIFIRRGEDWYTPPAEAGILNGVFRKYWLKEDQSIKEKDLYVEDLIAADEVVLTNSLRKKVKTDMLYLNDGSFRQFR